MALRSGRKNLYFELLADELWRTPADLFEHEKELRATKFTLGYRHMIRWWTRLVFERAHALGYGWVMRMDDDSLLHSRVEYDIFAYMTAHRFSYGYRLVSCEPIKHASYYRLLQRYVLMRGLKSEWLGEHCTRPEPEHLGVPSCGRAVWGVYNNFFVANVSFWMQKQVVEFLDYVDQSGVIYLFNWNDILWHTAVIKLFLRRDAVHHFRDFTYEHATTRPPDFTRVSWGMLHAGNADPKSEALVRSWATSHNNLKVQWSKGEPAVAYAGKNNCPQRYN